MRNLLVSSLLPAFIALASTAAAAPEQPPAAPAEPNEAESQVTNPGEATAEAKSGTTPDKDSSLVADAEAGSSPIEDPDRTYLFVGARYRAVILPAFMINLFADGGKTLLVHGVGPELVIRKNAFEYNFSIWYAGYGLDDSPFKAKDDGPESWEIVNSKLKVLFLTADFDWSHDFTPEVALNYGFGAGLGLVFGDLERVQAYPGANADANTGEGFQRCAGQFSPNPGYCDDANDHYGDYKESSWVNGGSKPNVFPWLALQTGLRYKPHRNFVGRLDAGFGTSGFFLGLGLDYGL